MSTWEGTAVVDAGFWWRALAVIICVIVIGHYEGAPDVVAGFTLGIALASIYSRGRASRDF